MAAHLLHKGDRATFAITYPLAFGERGSSTGLVPPFTPVVYSVEVVEVQRPSLP
jgi:FKBP-type peptidyl-prolyl cis-trans isomerase